MFSYLKSFKSNRVFIIINLIAFFFIYLFSYSFSKDAITLYIHNKLIDNKDFIYSSIYKIYLKDSVAKKVFSAKLVYKGQKIYLKGEELKYIKLDGQLYLDLSQLVDLLGYKMRVNTSTNIVDVNYKLDTIFTNLKKYYKKADKNLGNKVYKIENTELKHFDTLSTRHFKFFYKNKNIALELSKVAEFYYENILKDFRLNSIPGLSGKQIYVIIFKNRDEYLKKAKTINWSIGSARSRGFIIYLYEGNNYLVNRTFPHELTHIVFDNWMNSMHISLRWLTEGLAVWEEFKFYYKRDNLIILPLVPPFTTQGKIIPLVELTSTSPINYNSTVMVNLWYLESASLVSFLKISYGNDKFLQFCKNMKNYDIDKALSLTYYNVGINNLKDLQEKWLTWVRKKSHLSK